jgi:hypothetical protein
VSVQASDSIPIAELFSFAAKVTRESEENTIASLITSFLPDMTLQHEPTERCRNALDRNRSPYNSALQCESVRDLHDLTCAASAAITRGKLLRIARRAGGGTLRHGA